MPKKKTDGRRKAKFKSFSCSWCLSTFVNPRARAVHVRTQHSDLVNQDNKTKARPIDDYERLQCSLCNTKFTKSVSLSRHVKTFHSGKPKRVQQDPQEDQGKEPQQSSKKFECDYCGANFSRNFALVRHIQSFHDNGPTSGCLSGFCCPLCDFKGIKPKLYSHYDETHNIELTSQTLSFPSLDDFNEWKNQIENQCFVRFVKFRGTWKNKTGTQRTTYVCHRDGHFISRSTNKRHIKALGSNKIDGHCPARIELQVSVTGDVRVEYCSTHVGHEGEIGRMHLTKKDKERLKEKLGSGVPVDDILDELRDSLIKRRGGVEPIYMVTRKHLLNLLGSMEIPKEDITKRTTIIPDVKTWVESVSKSSNIVRFYKECGVTNQDYPEFGVNDFALVLARDTQLEILANHGNEFVCLDGLVESTADVELFTLLSSDEHHRAFPVAFFLTSLRSPATFKIFFDLIKKITGTSLSPKYFMSDIPSWIYTTWIEVFPGEPNRLYCPWHVEDDWRKNLFGVPSLYRASIISSLKSLMDISDHLEFSTKSDELIKSLRKSEDTRKFTEYAISFFSCSTLWAFWYREIAGVDPERTLEHIHKSVQYFFHKGQSRKVIAKGIQALVKYVREEIFDRALLKDNSLTLKTAEIKRRHANALKMSRTVLFDKSTNKWMVQSSNNKDNFSVRSLIPSDQPCTCPLQCLVCQACVHRYSCSCSDYSIRWNLCKHIHLICNILLTNPCLEKLIENLNESSGQLIQIKPDQSSDNDIDTYTIIEDHSVPGETFMIQDDLTSLSSMLNQQSADEGLDGEDPTNMVVLVDENGEPCYYLQVDSELSDPNQEPSSDIHPESD